MRILTCLTASLMGAALIFPQPPAASAEGNQTSNDQLWQSCTGAATTVEDRVSACSAVIDGKTETGGRLAGAYCTRGYGLTEQRQLDAALADLNEAIRLDPGFPCAYTNRGRAYAFKHDLDHAIADYDAAIRIDPTFALAYNNRGDVWLGKGDLDRALADFNAAIKYNPSLAIAYGNRGYISASATRRTRSPITPCRSSSGPTRSPTSTAAMSTATPNSSTAPPPTMARQPGSRRPTPAAGAIAD